MNTVVKLFSQYKSVLAQQICRTLFSPKSYHGKFAKVSSHQTFWLCGSWICQSCIVQRTFNSKETIISDNITAPLIIMLAIHKWIYKK